MTNAYNFEHGLGFARKLDQQDHLARFRDQFFIPRTDNDEEEIYLCGNSLGLQPRRSAAYVNRELENWQRRGVKGHFEGEFPWMPYHEFLTPALAELVGGEANEVVAMNSLTANLHLMMVSFYRPTQSRYKILMEDHAFPSDRYAVESQIRFHGLDPAEALIEIKPRSDDSLIPDEDVLNLLEQQGESIALVMLPGVQYYSGQVFDMGEITRLARLKGCIAGFDLAHAVGNIELSLHAWDVDFAVWCTYKYLNSGPGAVGGCFVHSRHANNRGLPRFAGWWGNDKSSRFEMGPTFTPISGVEGWQLSNPPILSLAAIRASLDVFAEAGNMAPLRAKSRQLTAYLEWLLSERLAETVHLVTPAEPERRGCQLSLIVSEENYTGRELFEHLNANGVTVDWREPSAIRVAPVPLYNSFEDCFRFVDALETFDKRRQSRH